jgi:glycosyl transferase family 87
VRAILTRVTPWVVESRVLRVAQLGLATLAVVCALAIDLGGAVRSVWQRGYYVGDFTVFWTAARVDPDIVYDVDAISKAQVPLMGGREAGPRPFVNPPSFLPWLEPFSRLPFPAALALWTILGLAAFAWACRELVRWRHLPLIATAPAFFIALVAGQVSLFIGAAIVTALLQLQRRPILSGAVLGFAATIKPQAVLLAPVALLAGGHWRALWAAAATGAIVGLSCVLVQGPDLWFAWLNALGDFGQISRRYYLIGRGLTPSSIAYLTGLPALPVMIAGAVLGLVTVWAVFRRMADVPSRIAALVAGSILCVPYAMPYEATPLLILAAMMLVDRGQHPLRWLVGFLLVSGMLAPFGVLAMALALLWSARPAPAPDLAPAGTTPG